MEWHAELCPHANINPHASAWRAILSFALTVRLKDKNAQNITKKITKLDGCIL